MNILFFMVPKEKVAFIFDDYSVRQALEKMQTYRYQAIPILNRDGQYVGTLSEGDLLWYIRDKQLNFGKSEKTVITKIPRSKDHVSISVNKNIEDLIDAASKQNFIPVLDDFGSFIGIVTRKDIMQYMLKKCRTAS
ncbi:MAG: CBS domain-containing protein [Acholeplasmataceae bacterium]